MAATDLTLVAESPMGYSAFVQRFACFAASLLGAISYSAETRAAEFELDWRAPDCASEAEFRQKLEQTLSRPPEAIVKRNFTLSVRIERTDSGNFELTVLTRHGDTTYRRELETKTCSNALEAAAVLVALALDPNAQEAAAEISDHREPEISFALDASAGIAFNELPQLSPLLALGAGLDVASFGVMIDAYRVFPQRAVLDGDPRERGGSISIWGGALALCYVPLSNPGRLYLCAAARGNLWISQGENVQSPRTDDALGFGVGLRARWLQLFTRHFGVFAQADGYFSLNRYRFYLENLGNVYESPRFGARLGLGAEFRF